jgi:hypothetical protein
VGHNQRGFIPGRDIRVSILEAKLALILGQKLGINGSFIIWDWEKAFDRVDRNWLFQSMERMNIGPLFLQSIRILRTNSQDLVEINGFLSNSFNVVSGVRLTLSLCR